MSILIICIGLILVFVVYMTKYATNTQMSSLKNEFIIQKEGSYDMTSGNIYLFRLPKNDEYIKTETSTPLTLRLPKDPKEGDVIKLVDQSDRYGWGNLLYKTQVNPSLNRIVGDCIDGDLFPYRGGWAIFVWNSTDKAWTCNAERGSPNDSWSGWYTLSFKGAGIAKGFGKRSPTSICSYMRIDATQNPIYITFYGGSPSYPLNIIVGGQTVIWDDESNRLTFPTYPYFLQNTMNQAGTYFLKIKDGTVFDLTNGGGWSKYNNIGLFELPKNMLPLN
jgi:hypothetical protein